MSMQARGVAVPRGVGEGARRGWRVRLQRRGGIGVQRLVGPVAPAPEEDLAGVEEVCMDPGVGKGEHV